MTGYNRTAMKNELPDLVEAAFNEIDYEREMRAGISPEVEKMVANMEYEERQAKLKIASTFLENYFSENPQENCSECNLYQTIDCLLITNRQHGCDYVGLRMSKNGSGESDFKVSKTEFYGANVVPRNAVDIVKFEAKVKNRFREAKK